MFLQSGSMFRQLAVPAAFVLFLSSPVIAQGGGPNDNGHLNTLERQSQFWQDATATLYTPGASGFFLQPGDDGSSTVVASVAAADGSQPQVWVVGSFEITSGALHVTA